MEFKRITALLRERGWSVPDDDSIGLVVKRFQGWHGLRQDGEIGSKTRRLLESERICGCDDVMLGINAEDGNALRKWKKPMVTWKLSNPLPRLTRIAQEDLFRTAFDSWEKVCALKFEKGEGTTDIVLNGGRIDGPRRTLAWSEGPPDPLVEVRFDLFENWGLSFPPNPSEIYLLAVAKHEFGHSIGIPHLNATKFPEHLMNATYNPRVSTLQYGEINAARDRYGAADEVTHETSAELIIDGNRYQFNVTKVQ